MRAQQAFLILALLGPGLSARAQDDIDDNADFMSDLEESGIGNLAETPYNGAASASASLSSGAAGAAASDVASSSDDCNCPIPGTCTTTPAGTCLQLGDNISALTAMLVTAAQSTQAKNGSAATAEPGVNPGLASIPQLGFVFTCQPGTASCKQPQFSEKVAAGIAAYRKAVENGTLKGAADLPQEEALRRIDSAANGLERVVGGTGNATKSNSLQASLPSKGGAGDRRVDIPMPASLAHTRLPGLSSVAGTASIRKSAKDGSDEGELYAGVGSPKVYLGTTLMGNSLGLKARDGSELSLFQRASRRFQGTAIGQQGMRALMLAKVEYLRTLTTDKVARFKKWQVDQEAEQARLRAIAAEVAKGQPSKGERKPSSIPTTLKTRN